MSPDNDEMRSQHGPPDARKTPWHDRGQTRYVFIASVKRPTARFKLVAWIRLYIIKPVPGQICIPSLHN